MCVCGEREREERERGVNTVRAKERKTGEGGGIE